MKVYSELLGKNYSQKLDGYYFQKCPKILGSCAIVTLIVSAN